MNESWTSGMTSAVNSPWIPLTRRHPLLGIQTAAPLISRITTYHPALVCQTVAWRSPSMEAR